MCPQTTQVTLQKLQKGTLIKMCFETTAENSLMGQRWQTTRNGAGEILLHA